MNGYALITEDGKAISLGRVSFWLLLLACIYFWFFEKIVDFPPTLFQAFCAVMLYNFGKKGVDLFNTFLETKKV